MSSSPEPEATKHRPWHGGAANRSSQIQGSLDDLFMVPLVILRFGGQIEGGVRWNVMCEERKETTQQKHGLTHKHLSKLIYMGREGSEEGLWSHSVSPASGLNLSEDAHGYFGGGEHGGYGCYGDYDDA